MSQVIDLEQFRSNVTPLKSTDQAQMKLWLQLGFSAVMPPQPNAWKGATPDDCQVAIERIKLATAAYLDFVATVVEHVRENLPMDQTVDLKGFVAAIEDVKNDAVALLEIAADTRSGM